MKSEFKILKITKQISRS